MNNQTFSNAFRSAAVLMLLISVTNLFSCKKESTNEPEPITVDTNKEGLTFETTVIDYVQTAASADIVVEAGVSKIKKGSDPTRIFKFTNTSPNPIIIKAAKSSCGCLVPTYPAEPILPGETNQIEVRYDTNRVGVFTKTVTVTASGNPETYTLTVKGDVNM